MKYYIELTLISDVNIPINFIWSKVYQQIHFALATLHNSQGIKGIGVSFPNYVFDQDKPKPVSKLGHKLRLFAENKSDLEQLDIHKWLEQLTEYVHIRSINEVPSDIKGHLVVSRHRYKDAHTVAKRFSKFKNISYSNALRHTTEFKRSAEERPFITLFSSTSNEKYQVAIKQEMVDEAKTGVFNSYGINTCGSKITVPHW